MAGFSVNIGADVKQLTAGLNTAKQELAKFDTAVKGTTSSVKGVAPGANQAAAALTNVGRVAQDLPFGFIGIQNNLNPLLESFQRLKAETGSSGAALKALGGSLIGAGGIGLALSIVSSAIVIFQNGIAGFNKKSKEAKEAADELAKSIRSIGLIEGEARASVEGQISQVNALAAAIADSNRPYAERKRALEELKEINKSYFNDLRLEDAATGALTKTIQEYTNALINSAIQKQFVDEIATVAKKVAEQDDIISKSRLKLAQAQRELANVENLIPTGTRDPEAAKNKLRLEAIGKVTQAQKELSVENEKVTTLLVQEALVRDRLNRAVAEGLKYKDLESNGSKKEEDLLKKRLEALEKIKDVTKDATALVGLQEAIFDLQVKIAIRDQSKNQLSKQEVDQLIQGYKGELQKAFNQQAIELEAIPKVRFSDVVRADISFKEVESKIAKATGLDKKIPEITIQQVRIKILGFEKGNFINQVESITADLNQRIRDTVAAGMADAFVGLGEGFGEALSSGDFGEGLKKAAQNVLGILGGVMQQIGKQVISAAIQIKLLKESLEKFAVTNPALAIIAGIGLVAAGAALKNVKFDGPKFATGGIVTGPVIGQIGEMHRPEVIMPLDRLPQMLRSIGGGGGNDLQLIPIINNEGLYLAAQRGARRAGRKF